MNILTDFVPIIVERDFGTSATEPITPPLGEGEIHVWCRPLDRETASVEAFSGLLSADEQYRARRFRFERDRNEFIVSRGTLRTLLAAYQGIPAGQLQFAYSAFGRPSLIERKNFTPIEFNISHSGGVTLLAFSRSRRIGIDIEEGRRDFDPTDIAEKFFSQSERSALRDLPPDLRYEAFFCCWTRKEAFIKALGEGLSHPLDAFDVSLTRGVTAALLATRPNADEVARWALRDIAAPEGYLASLAIELALTAT
jgi:4'-phosphopantetheinyl transferase